jgi:hypothetical protein
VRAAVRILSCFVRDDFLALGGIDVSFWLLDR